MQESAQYVHPDYRVVHVFVSREPTTICVKPRPGYVDVLPVTYTRHFPIP